MFDSIRKALGKDEGDREGLEAELARVRAAMAERQEQLESKREGRLQALFPQQPVAGAAEGRYPGLDPVNFEEGEQQSWLVGAATGIIDNFPGSEALLSQLDATLEAFCDANHYRVDGEGPYGELSVWRGEILRCWDLADLDVPVYVANGGGSSVLGCKRPLVVLDRLTLDGLEPDEQRFLLAASLGHVFFGNLRIFSFYRLMEMLDKLPSFASYVTRGLGMIPGIGNTIARGIELARLLNNQVIRKTNLVIGQRQHVLCDRLASLAMGGSEAAFHYLARQALGGAHATEPAVRARLVEQGRAVHDRFEQGQVDLAMMSVLGPDKPFAALRAYKLDAWSSSERAHKIAAGCYVTREELAAYRKSHHALEQEIRYLEERLLKLHERETKLRAQLGGLGEAAEEDVAGL